MAALVSWILKDGTEVLVVGYLIAGNSLTIYYFLVDMPFLNSKSRNLWKILIILNFWTSFVLIFAYVKKKKIINIFAIYLL